MESLIDYRWQSLSLFRSVVGVVCVIAYVNFMLMPDPALWVPGGFAPWVDRGITTTIFMLSCSGIIVLLGLQRHVGEALVALSKDLLGCLGVIPVYEEPQRPPLSTVEEMIADSRRMRTNLHLTVLGIEILICLTCCGVAPSLLLMAGSAWVLRVFLFTQMVVGVSLLIVLRPHWTELQRGSDPVVRAWTMYSVHQLGSYGLISTTIVLILAIGNLVLPI